MTEKHLPHRVDPQPTGRDRENARIRQEIARRQAEEYAEAERLALAALGPGWKPWMKLSLLDSDYHRTGNTEAVATVYKVYRGEAKLTENSVYLRRMPDGQIHHSCDYEMLFGELLRELHPSRTIEVGGQHVPCLRYSVWIGIVAIEVTYKDAAGRLGSEQLSRDREPTLEVAAAGRPWSFDGDGGLFRLLSEANRIRLAYLFDPLLAVHTSLVDPLPHQITAVYGEMLSRQPLRFLLADGPGAGKTIMTSLFIKELMVRGDLQRCLIVCPGNLAEQWQDKLDRRFHLPFEIMTNTLKAARTGNWFAETPLAICRLDKLSRDENTQAKLKQTDWDLIVCDEAHKLSATYFGSEIKYTRRCRLGRLLSTMTRHFLLLTATPHNGKEADFQLFMALLDGDRFEGKFRGGVHTTDAADLMRRLVKEQLLTFDGTPLFPERRAYTVS